jgi:hypothetical protein
MGFKQQSIVKAAARNFFLKPCGSAFCEQTLEHYRSALLAARDARKTIDPGAEMMLIAQNFQACHERNPYAI